MTSAFRPVTVPSTCVPRTGRFYDVSGSMGLKRKSDAMLQSGRMVYANNNPFLFTGKIVDKIGPTDYQIFNGTVTSCQLPTPDWLLSAGEFRINGTTAQRLQQRLPSRWTAASMVALRHPPGRREQSSDQAS